MSGESQGMQIVQTPSGLSADIATLTARFPLPWSAYVRLLSVKNEAARAFYETGCRDLIPLTIPHLRQLFGCEVGLSDHTMGIGTSVAAIALGASVLEKHFTLRRADGGVDSSFSLEPEEMRLLVTEKQSDGCVAQSTQRRRDRDESRPAGCAYGGFGCHRGP